MKKQIKKLAFTLFILLFSPLAAQDFFVFNNPTNNYGPYVWWHWAGSNFSKEGISKDLEAMKETGIAGATIFNITSAVQESQAPILNNPWPERTYRSEYYWDAMKHAARKVKELGLKLGLHNTVGYSTTGGPWIPEERAMQCVVSSEMLVSGDCVVDTVISRGVPPIYKGWGSTRRVAQYYKDISVLAIPVGDNICADDVINISEYMSESGRLSWKAPKGDWRIVRLGYAPTMSNPHPVPDELIGKVLEGDKMSVENNAYHWDNVLSPLKEHLSEYIGNSFNHILIDSYEAKEQNWTVDFENEFYRIKGYNPIPWLTGYIGTKEERQRFQYDYKDVIAHLYYKNGFKTGMDKVHEYGMELYFEPYKGPFNTVLCTSLADIPMGEFWAPGKGVVNKEVVGAARALGKRIIAAEAFTARPEKSAWTEDPAFLKYSADGAYCSGVNRLVLHHWVHQPFDDKYKPGLSMGWWGTHFGRHQSWFEYGKSFFKYLSRIQYMLQQGDDIGRFLYLDKVVNGADVISYDLLESGSIKVVDGNLVLPSGKVYPFLVCPDIKLAEKDVVEALLDLSEKGAVLVGERPEKSPGLCGYPEIDGEISALGKKIKFMESVEQAIAYTDYRPVYKSDTASDKLGVVVRKNGDKMFSFIANRTPDTVFTEFSLLSEKRTPEIWNPETGERLSVKDFYYDNGYINVRLKLLPNQTLFLVLNDTSYSSTPASYFDSEEKVKSSEMKIDGTWQVKFNPMLSAGFSLLLDSLTDFSLHTDNRVRYFTGEAIYTKEFHLDEDIVKASKEIILDLGEMNDIASIRINGKDAGVWWYPPYRKNVVEMLKPGDNVIEIGVVNNWANLLIGDEQYDADFEWGKDRGVKKGRPMKSYPDWFVENKERPSERKAFLIWYYHRKDTQLQPAGLSGPVKLCFLK